jgi:hypothetical protein
MGSVVAIRLRLRGLDTFRALGIELCSFPEQMDTSTPAGKMIFTVLGAVAELERASLRSVFAPVFAMHERKACGWDGLLRTFPIRKAANYWQVASRYRLRASD